MAKQIYLDYAATTPIDKRVIDSMVDAMENTFGNPASRSHSFGWDAEKKIEQSRQNVANLLNADSREIIFTSGATESNNLAIKGAAEFYQAKGKHIITSKTEHKAVLDTMRQLERQGFEVTYLTPDQDGTISLDNIRNNLRDDTILVSIMHVNNEIGIIQDIEQIGTMLRDNGIIFHVDAAQSAGKLPIDVTSLAVDLISISGHKMYGPKGIGALYVRRKPRVRLVAQIHGGGHERGFRSGTLATHQIIGLGEACKIANESMQQDQARITKLRNLFWDNIKDIEQIKLNSSLTKGVPNILNVSFNYIEGESLIMGLKNLAISSGSACTSASLEPSYVLRALGLSDELAHSSLRFSFGRNTSETEVLQATQSIHKVITKLRELSPLWEMFQEGIDLSKVEWVAH